jgi:hypothetical protein
MRTTLQAVQAVLMRLGDFVYVQPKMGAGSWTHRIEVA